MLLLQKQASMYVYGLNSYILFSNLIQQSIAVSKIFCTMYHRLAARDISNQHFDYVLNNFKIHFPLQFFHNSVRIDALKTDKKISVHIYRRLKFSPGISFYFILDSSASEFIKKKLLKYILLE